jgi:hypothetical protein
MDNAPKRPEWPYSSAEYCTFLKAMDEYYGTPKNSPLHHDNRCTLMVKD